MKKASIIQVIGILSTVGSFLIFNFVNSINLDEFSFIYSILFYGGILLFGFGWFLKSQGRIDFWDLASNHPEKAYEWFKKNPEWKVFEGSKPNNRNDVVPKDEWTGPFRLMVPHIGLVYVFGKVGVLESSQDNFINLVAERTSKSADLKN